MNLNLNEIWHKWAILFSRRQGVNQKIMCYDSKDNNNSRFQPLIKLVYPSPNLHHLGLITVTYTVNCQQSPTRISVYLRLWP